jgi:hypothetical protein
MEMNKEKEAFFSALMDQGKQIYAILNAAADPEIPKRLWWLDAEYVSLHKGEPEEKYADVTPYLVNLSPGGEAHEALVEWIFKECRGVESAVFLESDFDINALLAHLQRFTVVIDEAGKGLLFRFYDARVLKVYLPTCSGEESHFIFGPCISSFFMEGGDGDGILTFLPKPHSGESAAAFPEILTIRKEQMAALEKNRFDQFRTKTGLHLRSRFPHHTREISDEELDRLIMEGVEEAGHYGIDDQNDVKRFLEYVVQYGRDFGKSSGAVWANEILNHDELSGTMKMDQIDDYDLFVNIKGKNRGGHHDAM